MYTSWRTFSVQLSVVLCCFLGAHGQQPQASITGPPGPVSEADGTVDVCVNVTNSSNIPDGGAEVGVIVITAQGTATSDDYELQEQSLTFMPGMTSQCVSIRLVQDNLVEGSAPETMLVRVVRGDDGVIQTDPQSDIVTVFIQDSDSVTVGFTQSLYTALESAALVDLCTRVEEGQIAVGVEPIMVGFMVTSETATSASDFMMPLSNFMFNSDTNAGSPQCVQFTIVDDNLIEANETISVQLREAESVTFSTRDATILIQDNDFAMVALDQDQVMLVEGNDTMNTTLDFCVVLTDDKGGVNREVIVNITTSEVSATGLSDFVLLNDSVVFPETARQDDMKCFQVLVLGDNFIEVDEVFHVNISTFFPDLIGDPGSATVTINHDGDTVCSTLQNPSNGNVEVTGNTVGSVATYSCTTNYMLLGPQQRNCTADVGWNGGQDPVCLRSCDSLTIENGYVDVGLSVEGVVANYTCDIGYQLSDNSSRVCQSNGLWNGTDPVCQGPMKESTTTDSPVDSNQDNSRARNIGIGVGVGVGGFLLILVVIFVIITVGLLIQKRRASKIYTVNHDTNGKSGSGIEDSLQQSLPSKPISDDGEKGGLDNVHEVEWTSIHVVDNETSFTET